MKTCRKCGSSEFYGGKQRACKPCAKKRAAKYKKNHPDKVKQMDSEYQMARRRRFPNEAKDRRRALRRQVIAAYGGRCECCWESGWEFLSVDHKNGGGNKHREALGGSYSFYRWLRDSGFPTDEYRLLCMNCNFAIGKSGYCPHEVARKEQGFA